MQSFFLKFDFLVSKIDREVVDPACGGAPDPECRHFFKTAAQSWFFIRMEVPFTSQNLRPLALTV